MILVRIRLFLISGGHIFSGKVLTNLLIIKWICWKTIKVFFKDSFVRSLKTSVKSFQFYFIVLLGFMLLKYHVTGKNGNACLDLSDVILRERAQQMFWVERKGGREKKKKGGIWYPFFFYKGRQWFMVGLL